MFAIIKIPKHGLAVLAPAGTEGTVGAEGDGVEISGVTDVVRLQLAVGQVPDLHVFVPPTRDDDRVGVVGGEPVVEIITEKYNLNLV